MQIGRYLKVKLLVLNLLKTTCPPCLVLHHAGLMILNLYQLLYYRQKSVRTLLKEDEVEPSG